MTRDPWYKVVTPRREVREGRSFSPDEFAIALEQVVAGMAPADYRDPSQFFSRTCFTRALNDHVGMVLRRLAGETQNTSPVPLRISGTIPPELWNRLGTKLIPKLRAGDKLRIGADITVEVAQPMAEALQADVRQVLGDLNLAGQEGGKIGKAAPARPRKLDRSGVGGCCHALSREPG